MAEIQEEVKNNYEAFINMLPDLIESKRGKFALMRKQEIVDFFDTARDAYTAGQKLFTEDRLFSVQQIIDTPVDLGFFSYAMSER
jgi:hypothetical protein